MKPGKTGIARIIAAGGYSWQGLTAAFQHEAAFRQELFLALVLLPMAIWLADNSLESALMIACLFIVLIAEILNSAIEAVVDRFGPEQHELSGRAKDMGSAAVFLSLVNVVVVWALVLFF
ncbi:MAG: diacylglycerol kinase [gamma proteobacterium symbiont of Bathyaustriella thionipta]|nr:diacylglycerol kinase [gamma proteobacterium symbiont of Bathyaustriella thionipta]MCU7948475.1 diacylglycerol kinase [gamma proteobacterium symbiont of Bathyaustriella thionipta]MCU7952471.1 diacylglycerol kinase [gamma proteobacterium symbiont of Bathyaustriella thionipta]MCU7956800.1 diacylglycerol kinase [gamma proteobacterium symbiont of Bathyaustriella thionipta]MCU7967496.1 diacylglycerol kinase [gamma proteobacterium symbiont of Bathyaustriella thionipta]